MQHRLLHKIQNTILTLRFSILSIFISLFVAAMLIVISVTYYFFSGSISYVAMSLMQQVSAQVYDDFIGETQDVELESKFSGHLIGGGTLDAGRHQDLIDYTYNVMSVEAGTLPSVQSVLWGDETGSFAMAEKNDDNTISSEAINRTLPTPIHRITQHDLLGRAIKQTVSNDLMFDPRLRPWYIEAKKAKKFIWTDVHPFQLTSYLGITAATPVIDARGKFKGVFAMNIRLDYLRHFIENLKISEHGVAFIVNQEGKIIAFPNVPQYRNKELLDINALHIPWITHSFKQYQKTKLQEFIFNFAGKDYLAIYQPVPSQIEHGWLIAVVAPESDFLGKLVETNIITILVALVILFLGVYLMSKLVNRIIDPMNELVAETQRIKNFELNDNNHVHSRIKEINQLSDSIYSMKKGLRSFQRYVPAALVRQLIDTGHDVLIGGEKKQLAIFFSDIQDFTTILEKMNPEHLMGNLCEYFNELTHIIVQKNGTIDKYIGDSVMAFWGAPLAEDRSCYLAADAALNCVKRLEALNTKWMERGIEPFYTRIGLHYGEAIVGNLGSDERLNYTAIGDSINITSRLEGINKIYGTQIITSDSIYQAIKNDFILRYLDCIALKGKRQGIKIYELVAKDKSELLYDLDTYQSIYREAYANYQSQQWDAAIIIFEQCLEIYDQDTLARLMIERCRFLSLYPPPPNWDGVWRVNEK